MAIIAWLALLYKSMVYTAPELYIKLITTVYLQLNKGDYSTGSVGHVSVLKHHCQLH